MKSMKFYIQAAIGIFVLHASVANAQSTILDFEDLDPSPASYDVMPSPYNGFTFSGWYYGPDAFYTPGSGVIDLFTDYADPFDPYAYVITVNNEISSSTPFIFDGATFSGYSGVSFELYLLGSLVHTSASLPDAPDVDPYLPTVLSSGYGGLVDTVKVSGVQGYYSMDDLTFHAAPVPEPSTCALLALGMGVVGWRARRGGKAQ